MDEDNGKIICTACEKAGEQEKARKDFDDEINEIQGFLATIIHHAEETAFGNYEYRDSLYEIVATLIDCRRHCASIGREVFRGVSSSAPMTQSKAWRGYK